MGKVTIESIRQRKSFISPTKEITRLEVTYSTDKGYIGSVTLDNAKATEEEIIQVVVKDAKTSEALIGKPIEL